MIILVVAFGFMMLVIFGILLFAMRPTAEQKALDKRLTHIKTAPGVVAGVEGSLLRSTPDAGSFGWLETLAQGFKVSDKLQTLIIQSDTNITLGKLLFFCGVCALGCGGAMYLWSDNLLFSAPAALQAALYPILYLLFRQKRRLAAFDKGLADSIDMMSRSLRAGHSVVAAIGIVAEQAVEPVKFEFNEVFKKQNYGLPLREALMQLLDRVPSQDLRVLVTGMLVQKETGGNLAEILDRITFVIRERQRIKGEIRTHTAQGRLTGWILCGLPVVMLVLLNIINPGYSAVLFDTPVGHELLGAGVVLLLIGALCIRQIINSIEV
jgi:tight adherence protein B